MIYWYLNFKMVCDGRDEEGWIFLVAGFGLMGFFCILYFEELFLLG